MATPFRYQFQWYRGGVAIPGATTNQYTLTRADVGRYITAKVTAFARGHDMAQATTARAGIPTHNTTRPRITGTTRRGRTLTVSRGSWTPIPTTYSYRWYRGSTPIRGATGKTYKLTSYDVGRRIRVKVTVTRTRYVSGSTYSASTTTVRR